MTTFSLPSISVFLSQPHLQISKTQTFNLHLNTTFFGITQVTRKCSAFSTRGNVLSIQQ